MIDAHNHLQNPLLLSQIQSVLDRADLAGVRRMIPNAARPEDWKVLSRLAAEHTDKLVPAFGVHPWYVKDVPVKWSGELVEVLMAHPYAIVGETGLDFVHNPQDKVIQEVFFQIHLQAAHALNRPVVIHCVRAWGKIVEILESVSNELLPPCFLFHAYSGGKEFLVPLLKFNSWFSFSGTVLFAKNTRAREVLPLIPRDRLLLETDAPDLPGPPEYLTGILKDESGKSKSEPADVRLILRGVSQLLKTSESELEAQLESNLVEFLKTIYA